MDEHDGANTPTFSELYWKNVTVTSFLLFLGTSSTIGTFFMLKSFGYEYTGYVCAVCWAILMLLVHSYRLATKEREINFIKERFDHLKMIKGNSAK